MITLSFVWVHSGGNWDHCASQADIPRYCGYD